jgi:2,4-dienoyl-CoA reductase-like NADH-dependent reductase (Old Yellow Enzyme family)/thioredoxin reductase
MADCTRYPHLNSPLKVRNTWFRNRLMSGPGSAGFAQSAEPYPSDGFVFNFVSKARNNACAVVTLGAAAEVHSTDGHMITSFMDFFNPMVQHRYAEMAEMIKAEGAVPIFQCMPPQGDILGYDVSEGVYSEYVEGDGSVPELGKEIPAELLYQVARSYGKVAAQAKELGFEMVQLHMAYRHMLPGRFLSRFTNKRTDEFGGSLENRARFPLMCCEEIKRQAGEDMIVHVSITGEEDPEDYPDGLTLEETKEFARLAQGKIDFLSFRQAQIDLAQGPYFTGEHLPNRPVNHAVAEYIRENNLNMHLIYVCGGHDLDECEDLIASGDADIVITSRAWLANPDLGILMAEGRGDDVVPCLRCNRCHQVKPNFWHTICSVNPKLGLEHRQDCLVKEPGPTQNIAVIGGGPAGMKCAMELFDRGHKVTIFEKTDRLGGQLKLAELPYMKWTIAKYKEYLIHQVEKRGIRVVLNADIQPGDLDGKYDQVFVAIGAVPAAPPIPGAENAILFDTALKQPNQVRGRVVVIGGGEAGTETGLQAAHDGHDVLVLEMKDILDPECAPIHFRRAYREQVWEKTPNFHWELNATVERIEPGAVYYRQDGELKCVETDTVILATGTRPLSNEAFSYGPTNVFRPIGDCAKIGNLGNALRSAYYAANNI